MTQFWKVGTVKSPAGCNSFAAVMRGVLLAAMAMLVLIVPATAVDASPRQQTVVDICSRTLGVQEAILDYIDFNNPNVTTCSTVTATQLAQIQRLYIDGYSASSIVSADFAGLTRLEDLGVRYSPALNAVPANAFSQVTNLTSLSLNRNSIRSIPGNAFAGLTALTELYLEANYLSSIYEDAFDDLTALEHLQLRGNTLTTLDADIFDGLTALDFLDIDSNSLTTLDAGPHPSRASRRTRGR